MIPKDYKKTAIIYKDIRIDYSSLIGKINALSNQITNDISKAAIFSENSVEWIYAFYATWKRNGIVVPIDFMSSVDDVNYILNDCKPEIIFHSDQTIEVCEKAVENIMHPVTLINLDNLKHLEVINDNSDFAYDPNKTAVIIYTSGTTGSPKGVMLSFDNLKANVEAVTTDFEVYTPEDSVLILLPLHHIFPLAGTVILPLSIGANVVISPSMTSEDIMSTLQNNKVTMIIGVPRLYSIIRKGIRDRIDKSKIAGLLFKLAEKRNSLEFSRKIFKSVQKKFGGNIKYFVSGGAALDVNVAKDFRTLGFEILEGFGMTECAPMITFTRPGRVHLGSAGQPLESNEVKILDGEVITRGRNVMQGYYNNPEATAEIIKDGWLHTGDLGYLDEQNRIFITGRKKEIIVLSNGKNINPEEVENKIQNMSEVINEIGVFEKSDMLHAVIYPDYQKVKSLGIEKLEEILKWQVIDVYNKSVTPYKKVMRFSLVKEPLPRTRLGKLKRFLLPQLEILSAEKTRAQKEPDSKTYKFIKDFIQQQKEITVHPSDHLEIDLGMDSLDKLNLQVYLESTFGIKLTEAEMLSFANVSKLAEHIDEAKTKMNEEAIDWGKILKEELHLNLPQSWFTHNLMKNAAKLIFKIYFRLKGEGLENIPDAPFILAPNHQSFFDGLFVAVFIKNKLMKKTYFYAKEKHVKNKLIKFIADKNNIIVMDLSDLKVSLQKMAQVLKRGKNLIIFPEGTRSKDGKIGDFKKTFAILSRELNVPVVPVVIDGAYNALPTGKIIPRPWKKINVKFLKPINPEDHTYDSLKDKVFNDVVARLGSKGS